MNRSFNRLTKNTQRFCQNSIILCEYSRKIY